MEGVSTVVAAKISSAEAKLIDAIKDYLSENGEDINRDGLIDTPERFVKQSLKITHIHGDFLMVKNFSSWCDFTPTLESILAQSCKSNPIHLTRHAVFDG